MPTIEMPDGNRLQFPDDMPHAAIRDAIQSKYLGNEAPSVGEPLLKQAEQNAPGAISVADATKPTIAPGMGADNLSVPAEVPEVLAERNRRIAAEFGIGPHVKAVQQGVFAPAIPLGRIKSEQFPGPAAIANTALGVIETAESPGGLAATVLSLGNPYGAQIIAGLFGAKAIHDLPEAAKNAVSVTLDPKATTQEKNEAWLGAGVTAAQMPLVLGAVHAAIEPAKAHFENLKFDLESQRTAQETARKATLPTPMAVPEKVAAAGAPATAEALKETEAAKPVEAKPPEPVPTAETKTVEVTPPPSTEPPKEAAPSEAKPPMKIVAQRLNIYVENATPEEAQALANERQRKVVETGDEDTPSKEWLPQNPSEEPTPVAEAGKKEATPTKESPLQEKEQKQLGTTSALKPSIHDLEEEANDFIKDLRSSKQPPKTADEAWDRFRSWSGNKTRGTQIAPEDYFRNAWELFNKPKEPPAQPPAKAQAEVSWLQTPSVRPGGKKYFWNAYLGEAGKGSPFMRVVWNRGSKEWDVLDPTKLDADGRSTLVSSFPKESEAKAFVEKQAKAQQPAPPPAATEGPTVVSGAPPSPSAIGVSPASLSISMSVNPKLVPAIRGTLKTVSGETMPKTTMANREAGEAGARYGSSPFYAHYAARALSETVLPQGSKIDPAQLGAALTEDALRGRRVEFLKRAHDATTKGNFDEAQKYLELAANVGTTVGKFGLFRDEAALQVFIKQPDVLAAVDRLKQLYAANLDPLATQAGLDITKKPQGGGLFPGAFINLFVPQEGGLPSRTTVKTRPVGEIPEAGPHGPSSGVPRLTATMKKRSRFGLQRTGASEIYGVDFHDMVANAFGGFTEIARKNEFDKALVDAGLAKIQQESPGQGWTHFPYEKKQILGLDEGDVAWRKSVNKGVWVRNDIAGEYSRVSNVYRNPFSNTATRFLLDAVNKFQMLGILDATFHSSALLRRLWEAPLGKADTALSLLRPADIARRLSMVAENIFQDRLAKNEKLAELANIGALTGHGQIKSHQIVRSTVNFLEENIRLTLSDMYDKLVDEGYPDTETARREYINAGLQYNKRFQGPVVQFLRNFGVGPFVTAGRAGLARGIRRWFLQDWIPGQDAPSQAWTAANVLTKMAGTALLVGTINHLVTGKWTGRSGTPLGNVDTGKDDEKTGRPLSIPLANLMGSEMRGARALGLKAVAEGLRDNAPLSQVIDSAYKDSFNAISHPGIGPAAQAIYGLTYGKPTAIGAPEYPKVAPGSGRSQTLSNAGHAFEELNPMIVRAGRNLVSWATGGKVEPSEEGPMERVKGVAVQKGQKPMEPEEKQQMITFAQLRKYTDYLTSQARQLPREKRLDYILQQFDKDKLGEDFRAKALEQIKRHGVLKYD